MFHTQEHAQGGSTHGVASDEQSTSRRTLLRPPAPGADANHRHEMLWWVLLIIAFIL
jgi:hypothetical protein